MSNRRFSKRSDSDKTGQSHRQSIDLKNPLRSLPKVSDTEEALNSADVVATNFPLPKSRPSSIAYNSSGPASPRSGQLDSDTFEPDADEVAEPSSKSSASSKTPSTAPHTPQARSIFDGDRGTPDTDRTDDSINDRSPRLVNDKNGSYHVGEPQRALPRLAPRSPPRTPPAQKIYQAGDGTPIAEISGTQAYDESPRPARNKNKSYYVTESQSASPGSSRPVSPNSTPLKSSEREPTQPDISTAASTIRDRRQQTATERSGRYFRMASNLRKDAKLRDLDIGLRRNSQPGYRANVLSPIMPNTATTIDYYGPFRAMFHESLVGQQQQIAEDIRRVRETQFIRTKEGGIIPRGLIKLIAARRNGQRLTMADLREHTTPTPTSYDDFEQALRRYGADEISGSELINEPWLDHPITSFPTTSDDDKTLIQQYLGWVSYFIRFNHDILEHEGFRELRWVAQGNLRLPTFNFARNWSIPDFPGLAKSALKWVLDLLIFLLKQAAEFDLVPFKFARDMITGLLENLKALHVDTDYIGDACSKICRWSTIKVNEYVPAMPSMPSMPENLYIILFALVSIAATYLSYLGYSKYGQEISLEGINTAGNKALQEIIEIFPSEESLLYQIRYRVLVFLVLVLILCWDSGRWAARHLFALPGRLYNVLSTNVPRIFNYVLFWLQDFATKYELRSKLQAVYESLYWLVPFFGAVAALWKWGSLRACEFYAIHIAKHALDVIEDGFEAVATTIDEIPYDGIRNSLLNVWLLVLHSFYVAREFIAPLIGLSTVAAFLTLALIFLDQTVGKGYFLGFLKKIFNNTRSFFRELPGYTVSGLKAAWNWIDDFLGLILIIISILAGRFGEKVANAYDWLLDIVSFALAEGIEWAYTIGDFFADLWADLRSAPVEVHEQVPVQEEDGQVPVQRIRQVPTQRNWLVWAVLKWIFNTLSVALGVWFAMFVCGLCLSCMNGSCLNGTPTSPGTEGVLSSFPQILALGIKKQLVAIEQLGHMLARSSTQQSLEIARRDEMLLQKMDQVMKFAEDQNVRNGAWSVRKMLGIA